LNGRRIPKQSEVCFIGYLSVDACPIRAKGADYLLALKDNQPRLAGEVQRCESAT